MSKKIITIKKQPKIVEEIELTPEIMSQFPIPFTFEEDKDYVDYTKFFEAKHEDFSTVVASEDYIKTVVEIYKKLNNSFPFCKSGQIKDAKRKELYKYMVKKEYTLIASLLPTHNHAKKDSFLILVSKDKNFMVVMDEFGANCAVRFLFNHCNPEHLKEIDKILLFSKKKAVEGRIFLLVKNYGELELVDFNIKNVALDFTHYNDNFQEAHSKIVQFSNSDESGLVLLYSEPGMGKTFYLRSLVNETKKKVVFITKDAISAFASPDFLGFAISQLKDCILYVEDGDSLLSNEGGRTDSTVNLLQLSDGIIGDLIRPKIIMTFNCPLDSIDPACKRKGRMKLKYNFEKLAVDKANALLKKLGKNIVATEPMSLADIYNTEENVIEPEEVKKFGF